MPVCVFVCRSLATTWGVENISDGGDLTFVFHCYEDDMPPVPKGGAFALDIFPMGILLVWFVGKGGVDK